MEPRTVTYRLVPATDPAVTKHGWTHEVVVIDHDDDPAEPIAGKLYRSLSLARKGLAHRSALARKGGHHVTTEDTA